MLKYMRDNTGSWIIKILLGLIVLVFVFLGMGSMRASRGNKVATVNDETITIDEFQKSYQTIMDQVRQRFGDNLTDEMIEMLQVKKQAIDSLIDERLVAAQAENLKIEVTDKEVKDSILAIPTFRRNNLFDIETYKRVLAANRWTPEVFEQLQRDSLKLEKLRKVVLSSVTVSRLEASEYYRFMNTAVGVDYLVFKPDAITDVSVDDAAVQEYYEANKDRYKSEPLIRARYLEFTPDDYKDKVTFSDDKLLAYYTANPARFKVDARVEARHILIGVAPDASENDVEEARKKAEDVYGKAKAGEDFSELAKNYSEGPSKDSGGYLGFFTRDAMVKPFADKAFSMKPGEISEPVKTEFGWHVIKVESSFPESTTSFANAKDDIKRQLEGDELKSLAYNAAGVAFDAIIEGDDLDQAALLTDKKVFEAGPFPINWKGSVVSDSEKFAETAFSLPVDGLSDVVQLGDAYYIIQPVQRIESQPLALEQVRHRVLAELTKTGRQDQAKKNAEAVLAAVKEKTSIADVAKEKGLSVKSTPLFIRTSNVQDFENSPDVLKASFSVSENQPIYPEVIQGGDGYYIVAFREQQVPAEDEIQKNLDSVTGLMRRAKEVNAYKEWLVQLRNSASIKIEDRFLN